MRGRMQNTRIELASIPSLFELLYNYHVSSKVRPFPVYLYLVPYSLPLFTLIHQISERRLGYQSHPVLSNNHPPAGASHGNHHSRREPQRPPVGCWDVSIGGYLWLGSDCLVSGLEIQPPFCIGCGCAQKMASLDFDQKFLGRIAKQTASTNPLLSASLYQILGLSVLLSRRLVRARKLRKLDTSRDTPSLAAYQHILWLSREGLSILELYVLPYAQDNQHGPECRVLSVKLRASFYHIFCLFHNQPPITVTNMPTADPRAAGAPPMPLSPRQGNGQSRRGESASNLSPSSKRAGKQPMLREPVDSITSETSFLTNPYAAGGGPVGTPSPGPPNAPPGLNPVPIPQPSSFILPPLNFIPLAGGHFTTATAYATAFLPGSHPLRLSVALEHAAFLWDCLHDHEGSRRTARRAIKDVYRAQEGMDDSEFEDAAELVGILGRMMKRKSWEGTPRVPGTEIGSPVAAVGPGSVQAGGGEQGNGAPIPPSQQSPQTSRRAAENPPITNSPAQSQRKGSVGSKGGRSRSNSATKPRNNTGGSQENTPRVDGHQSLAGGGGSQDTTPRAKHLSMESGGSTTPRAPQGAGGRSPATPSTVRTIQQQPGSGGSNKGKSPFAGNSTPISPSVAATLASDAVRASPNLRRSPRSSPTQESTYKQR
ncbi:14-3-3 protein [Zopfia rhizophila CBS 207.26]|uniref:14-3-3 protein n=1 Tax=Zopfia rhizophila CBS 207.26 TaxID=1314779 RepID=A0A6A6ECR9_9PEZI|nr:14-3-3 protein [Zopfia rhizophila CBS 207.26]